VRELRDRRDGGRVIATRRHFWRSIPNNSNTHTSFGAWSPVCFVCACTCNMCMCMCMCTHRTPSAFRRATTNRGMGEDGGRIKYNTEPFIENTHTPFKIFSLTELRPSALQGDGGGGWVAAKRHISAALAAAAVTLREGDAKEK